jgi:hypothetical protein
MATKKLTQKIVSPLLFFVVGSGIGDEHPGSAILVPIKKK